MRPGYVRRTAIVTGAISASLLVVACLGAWFVHHIHQINAELLGQHVKNALEAEELEIEMRDIRNRLNRYLRTEELQYLELIPKYRERATHLILQARARSHSDEETQQVAVLETGYDKFFVRFQDLVSQLPSSEAHQGLSSLIDDLMAREIFAPARRIVELRQQEIVQMAELETQVASRMGIELILLGACGAGAGAIGGYGLARSLQRLLIELSVSVHGVAGKLAEVTEPLTLHPALHGTDLEQALQQISDRVTTVVRRIEEGQREMQRAEQLAMVGQLAAGLAHELRNTVMPVKLLVDSAIQDDSHMTGEDLRVVAGEINRLEMAVNRLLEFARPSSPQRALFDLRPLVSESLRLIVGRANVQRVTIRECLPPHPVLIDADKEQLRQVTLNLLLNALDAMPTGGELCVSLHLTHDKAAVFSAVPAGKQRPTSDQQVTLTIADTGCGLPPQVADRVFEPFVTSKATGTGLGLSICKRIVEAHGGQIRAVNRAERGTEFSIQLPTGCT